MQKPGQPTHEHTEFDEICATVDDFEPLPAIRLEPSWVDSEGEGETPIDAQILAGLVSPC